MLWLGCRSPRHAGCIVTDHKRSLTKGNQNFQHQGGAACTSGHRSAAAAAEQSPTAAQLSDGRCGCKYLELFTLMSCMVFCPLQQDNSHAGHAKLHDFCMTIPYGAIALFSGLVALVFKAPAVGVQLAGAGGVVSICSVLSLKSWKAGGGSTLYTLTSAGVLQGRLLL